ncbi:MAG: hypothetical protein KME45_10330 [Stenomitos rutilans HA7619-LM2]|jgi:hypothetical protein|nr:hypothetical protein [Stenomitos rutilans HA7619-LM2]
MSIAEQTPQPLILHRRSFSFRSLASAVFNTLLGAGLLLWSGPAKLDCQKIELTQVTCQFNTPGWLGLAMWRNKPIHNLQGVRLDTSVAEGMFYKIVLLTSEGEVPLRPYQTSGWDNTRETVDRIQTFLKDPAATHLSVAQVDWLQWWGLAPGALFFLLGLRSLSVSLFSIKTRAFESYQFDSTQHQLIYRYGSLLRRHQEQYPFSHIQRLIVDLDQWAKARFLMELRSGEVFCLVGASFQGQRTSLLGLKWQQVQPLADQASHYTHRSWQLTIDFWHHWVQQQTAKNQPMNVNIRFFHTRLEPVSVWSFDWSTRSLSHQGSNTVDTYKLKDVVEVQTLPVGDPIEKDDDDVYMYYEVNYQLRLLLSSGKPLLVKQFSSHEYHWKPTHVRKAAAQEHAETTAQYIREYICKN